MTISVTARALLTAFSLCLCVLLSPWAIAGQDEQSSPVSEEETNRILDTLFGRGTTPCTEETPRNCDYHFHRRIGSLQNPDMFTTPDEVERLASEARLFGQLACDNGYPQICYELGIFLAEPPVEGLARDAYAAADIFRQGCELGNGASCGGIIRVYTEYKSVMTPAARLATAEKGCSLDDRYSCHEVGYIYYSGEDVPRNMEKALAGYEKGCRLGQPFSCGNLALYYEHEAPEPRDMAKVGDYALEACNNGAGRYCYKLALMVSPGGALEEDAAMAEQATQRACALGYQMACPSPDEQE